MDHGHNQLYPTLNMSSLILLLSAQRLCSLCCCSQYGNIFATIIFRCDILLLLCPLGLELLLTKSISLWKAIKCCIGAALFCIGLTVLVDSIMWRRLLWPEFEVLWFNSVLNRSSEWGVSFVTRNSITYVNLMWNLAEFIKNCVQVPRLYFMHVSVCLMCLFCVISWCW